MKAKTKRGKFIVIYGINNLGKTTQAKLLFKALKKKGFKAEYIKYPIYDLEPAGPLIDDYLRKGNKYNFSPREFELLHFIDRLKFEPILQRKLERGINVVAEDYFGTGVAWGIGTGVSAKLLEYFYSFVRKEDLAFLFDGERFRQSIEKKHHHETNDDLVKKVRKAHLYLGRKYHWHKINANLPIADIHRIILKKVLKALK